MITQKYGPLNILEVGAKGDGRTDDTDAIQEAINWVCRRGSGKIFFPYTPHGYRIAKPAREEVDGHRCRSQLYIPYDDFLRPNIQFEGETPCRLMYSYMVRRNNHPALPNTTFARPNINTYLFSDWDAPEEHDPAERPWSMLGALEGDFAKGRFGVANVSIHNLELQSRLHPDRLYPTVTPANLQNVTRVNISNSQFCLDRHIGDAAEGRWLQPNPSHTAGLIASGDQNDNNILHNVSTQGFKYGFVLGEHVVADYLYVHNTEYGLIFHDSSHQSYITHIVAQHNQRIICTTQGTLFGMSPGPCHVEIATIDFEPGGPKHVPEVSNMTHGVWDPDNRLHGSIRYHCGSPVGLDYFPIHGGANVRCQPVYIK